MPRSIRLREALSQYLRATIRAMCTFAGKRFLAMELPGYRAAVGRRVGDDLGEAALSAVRLALPA
jgi:hypothetical protein